MANRGDQVGPVLQPGAASRAVIAAIQEQNDGVEVNDRGGYLRVLCPRRCVVTADAIAAHLGRAFRLPGDLELVMPAFKGRFSVSESQAEWTL